MKSRCRSRYSGAAATARPTVEPTFRSATGAGRVVVRGGAGAFGVIAGGCVRVGSAYPGLELKLLLGAGSSDTGTDGIHTSEGSMTCCATGSGPSGSPKG